MFKNLLTTALRNCWKNKTYSFLNIFGLAIGIACAGLIFLWVEDEINFDQVYAKKDRLYSVQVNSSYGSNMFTMGSTPRPLAASLKAEIPGIVNAARISDDNRRLLFSTGNKSLYASGRYADSALFSMLTLPFAEGNARTAFQQLYSIVLTQKTAEKFFPKEKNIIGKSIRLDNKKDYTVTGVIKDFPENSTLQVDWLAPYQVLTSEEFANLGNNSDEFNWGSYGPFTYVELDSKANLLAINQQIKDYIHHKQPKETTTAFLFPMKNWRLHSEFANGKPTGGGRIEQIRMLAAIAWIVLFIACINFMNLATANSQQRSKEVGVRKVLGARKNVLVAQFISEALFMSLLAGIVSIVIIILALPAFNTLMQKNLSLSINNPVHIVSLLVIIIVCGLIAGSYPSLYLSSFNPVLVLKGIKIKGGSASMVRKGLVIVQFVVSVVFIISTIIVYMQIQHIKNRDLGFNKNNLLEINPQHDISAIFPLIEHDLLQTGLIESAAVTDHTTLYGGDTDNGFRWEGKSPDNKISIAHRNVSPGFIATSGMKIIEGEDFGSNTAAATNKVIINEAMEKMMGGEKVIGKIIQSQRGNQEGIFTDVTVIGVVKDYLFGNMYGKAEPLIIFCKPPEFQTFLYIRAKPGKHAEALLSTVTAVMKKHNPAYPLEYAFADEQFNAIFKNETLISKASTVFAALAIFISCLGLFGLAAYTATQRTKEIGIRKVLGASVAGLAGLLSADFLRLVGISCLVAFPMAWWIMHNWLQQYEYRITISWWIFLVAGAVTILIAIATISFQTIKAAIANPVKSLRTE